MAEEDFHKKSTQPGFPEYKSSPPTEVPKMIGPYKIESLLEKGGMSMLYLGTHPETKEPTTIKVLLPRFLSNPEVVKRFLTEAEIIAMADHPNIVKLYGHGEWEGGLYIAMEFIEGISLRQALLQSPMSLKRSLEIIIDIGYAICHLHTHGVIHRDLKPENILITESGQIKVIDFGIAQLLADNSVEGSQQKQRVIGTPIYMSPEQRENPESVTYPSDIYSLGIIAYELVLGKLSHGQIHLSLMPKGLQKILNKALQPKPEDRHQDIVDFITDVSSYLNSTNIQKEKKVGDQLSELSENLKQAQIALASSKIPEWEDVEIGFSNHKGVNTYGIYYEFFKIEQKNYGIIVGESGANGAEGMILTSMLRGMVKALGDLGEKPAELMKKLNTLIINDKIDKIFTLSYLILNPQENILKYTSCGYGNLWRIPSGKDIPIKLSTNNIALGIDLNTEFAEVIEPWEPGDCLVLSTNSAMISETSEENEFSEKLFKENLLENINSPPQRIVDSLMRKAKILANKLMNKRSLTLISFLRKKNNII